MKTMKKIALGLSASIAVLALVVGACYLMMLPPALAEPAKQPLTLAGVTIINPGQGRLENQTMRI